MFAWFCCKYLLGFGENKWCGWGVSAHPVLASVGLGTGWDTRNLCWCWAAGQQPPLCLPQTTALLASQWAAASVSAVASCLIASVLVNMFSPSLRSP